MRILIFGATGRTGRQLVAQALKRGHAVTAFARTPGKLTLHDSRLTVIRGDVRIAESIHPAVPGPDAVLSALGTRSLRPTTLLSEAARRIVHAMEVHGVRRILWQSSLGVGETRGQLGPLYNWLLIPLLLRRVFADKERQEAILRATPLDWTIVQPAALTPGPRTGTYCAGPGAAAGQLFPRISRADVAHFLLEELEQRRHVRQAVPLCYCPRGNGVRRRPACG
ncbi:MAG: 3 beta-hydroxysteroid dehydrogenase/Delta 5--_4-isomerase [Gemmataceae bacterium]|nr:3 beta-hydroxysteroid dehydrogenase/Delta 5-->4-isomerase [Gemmataceae bacterium]